MRTRGIVVELRPQVRRAGSAIGTRHHLSRETRDGHLVSKGPLTQPHSIASLIARDVGMILFVAAAVTLVVAWVADGGFEVSVPVQSVEEDDAPRGDR